MDYPNNSNQAKTPEQRPDITPVAKGELKQKPTAIIKSQFYTDDMNKIGTELIKNVFIPTVKKLVVDAVNGFFNMIFYNGGGSSTSSTPGSKITIGGRTNYNAVNNSQKPAEKAFDFNFVVVESPQAAKDILDQMQNIIDQYGTVRVSEMCQLAGITAPYTYVDYGWDTLVGEQRIPYLDGRVKIVMPTPKYLK